MTNIMATYISLVQFTDKGIHAAKETTQRVADWAAKVQSKGVTIKQMYWTLGHYDQVCIFEAQTTRRPPACCYPRISSAISGRRRSVLLRASRWRRFSPTFPDRTESERFCESAGRLLLGAMIAARAGPQWSFVGSLRDEARLYRGLSHASTTGQWAMR